MNSNKDILLNLLKQHQELGITEQIDYDKFYLYSIITHSTAIEGSTVTEVEAQLLFDEGITSSKRTMVEQMMNLDLKVAYEYGREWIKDHKPITVDWLVLLASKVMARTGSEYNAIGGSFSAAKGEIRLLNVTAGMGGKSYMSYLKVPAKLQAFCEELNRRRAAIDPKDVYAVYELSYWAHFELVTIHPWADGNGRTCRLLMNLLQMEFGVLPTKVLKQDKAQYIQALIDTREQEDISIFINCMHELHCEHLRHDIDQFLQTSGEKMVDNLTHNNIVPVVEQNDIIIYHSKDGKINVALMTRDGNVWLNQQQIATLFATSKQNVGQHIANILRERELDVNSVVKNFFTTASDGKSYDVTYYSLQMIIAVGFRVRGVRGTQFRQWANNHLSEYLIKGFTMDDERLKNPDGRPDYFDEMLERIRDIRRSEKRFYQKLRELFRLSSDYEVQEKATQMFFAETQNKLLYAVTDHTAAEIIVQRAHAELPNMGLTTWKGDIVRKGDIIIAKNYLNNDEIDRLNRLVTIFLESAEMRVKERKDLTLDFWRENVNNLLSFQGLKILVGTGHVSNAVMEAHVKEVYSQFDTRRRAYEAQLADQEDLQMLEELEKEIKNKS